VSDTPHNNGMQPTADTKVVMFLQWLGAAGPALARASKALWSASLRLCSSHFDSHIRAGMWRVTEAMKGGTPISQKT
jgi:hypothetical protein